MNKRLGIIMVMVIAIVLVVVINNNFNKKSNSVSKPYTCDVDGCDKSVAIEHFKDGTYSYGDYCAEHTCEEKGCQLEKKSSDKYCSYHNAQIIINEQNNIKLTAQQISDARKIVDEYCETILQKHSYIGAIHIVSDTPETAKTNIIYHCLVGVNSE